MTMASPRLVSRTNIREWFSGDSPLHPFGGGQHADERRRDDDDQEEVLPQLAGPCWLLLRARRAR